MLQAPGISIKNLSADRIAKQIIQTVKDTKEQREFWNFTDFHFSIQLH